MNLAPESSKKRNKSYPLDYSNEKKSNRVVLSRITEVTFPL